MTQTHEDPVEDLLRKQFEGAVRDDGFSDRFMQQLPRRRRLAWPVWLGIVGGVFACGLSLADSPLLGTGIRDLMAGRLSPPSITMLLAMTGITLLACGWSLMEADDR